MKTTAALLWETPGAWDVREVDLDPPKAGEVLVQVMASGLCHSDDHFAQGDIPFHSYPACGGHGKPASSAKSGRASPGSRRATTSSRRSSRRAGTAGCAWPVGRTCATTGR